MIFSHDFDIRIEIAIFFLLSFDSNTPKMTDGIKGGPLAVFDSDGNTVLISPSDNFMAISMWHDQSPGGTVNWGVMGGVDQIPAGYSVRVVAVAAPGINQVGNFLTTK